MAAGVWHQRDDALCSPQHWGNHHYALELEHTRLTAGDVLLPVSRPARHRS